ncbi:UNVERIFIED_CONTAM: MFS transporter, partial [Bacteroidetes bacterium 56_B9]
AALIVVPFGQPSLAWFCAIAALAILILWRIGQWYKPRIVPRKAAHLMRDPHAPSPAQTAIALVVLVLLVFSKFFYMASITSYYTFYLIH